MEIEFKFQIPADRLDALKADLRSAPTRRTRLRARYFDTADGTLAAHGAVLRLRREGDRWVQTAKALGDGPLHRLEHNVDLGAATAGAVPSPDVRRHAGTPVGARIARLLEEAALPLAETYGTDVWRLAREVGAPAPQGGGATVELALDLGHVAATPAAGGAPRRSPVCELELELVDGDIAGLVALARRWSQTHGLWLSTVSKAEQGERLMAGLDAAPAVKARPPRFAAGAEDRDKGRKKGKHKRKGDDGAGRAGAPDGASIQRAVVAACLAQMLPNASEIAAGRASAEVVHQLRVGIRRLRTALRELHALGPGFDPAWEPPLVEAFRGLGARRDRELRAEKLVPRLEAAGAPPALLEAESIDTPAPVALVRAPAFQGVLVDLIGFAAGATPPPSADGATALDAAEARHTLARRLRKLHRRLVADARDFDTLDAEARHGVRKKLKRLRYLSEFVAPLFDAKAAERYLAHLAPAQDALGEANDEASALAAFRTAAARDPRAWFAVGWLSARQDAAAKASQRALRRIARAPKFWKHEARR